MKTEGKTSAAEWLGWLMLVVPPLIWAGNFVVGRATSSDMPPALLTFARHCVALVVILPFAWKTLRRDLPRYWRHRWLLVRLAVSGMVIFNLFVYLGLHTTTASNGQLLNSAIPVLIILFSALFLRQRLEVPQILGLLLSCFGVLVIVLHGELSRLFRLEFSTGDLIVFAAMVSFAFFSIWLRAFPADMSRIGLLAAQFAITIVVLLPFVVIEYLSGARPSGGLSNLAAVLYVGIAAAIVANLLYVLGVARVGPARAGLFIHLIPIYGAFLSSIVLGESLHLYHAVGLVAIIAGLVCSQSKWGKRVPAASS